MKETDPVTRHHGRAEIGRDAVGCSRDQGVPTLPGSVPVTASRVSLLCIKVTVVPALLLCSYASSLS